MLFNSFLGRRFFAFFNVKERKRLRSFFIAYIRVKRNEAIVCLHRQEHLLTQMPLIA